MLPIWGRSWIHTRVYTPLPPESLRKESRTLIDPPLPVDNVFFTQYIKIMAILTKVDIDWLIESMKLVFPTKEETTGKMNEISEKLDTFIGEIQTRRSEQTLHAGTHRRINDRLDKLEKKPVL